MGSIYNDPSCDNFIFICVDDLWTNSDTASCPWSDPNILCHVFWETSTLNNINWETGSSAGNARLKLDDNPTPV